MSPLATTQPPPPAPTRTPSTIAHITLDERGRANIEDTRYKVIHIAGEHVAWLWSPEAIQRQHSDLSLAQIYAALAYYYDHKADLDAEMAQIDREVEAFRHAAGESPLTAKIKKLREAGLL